MASLKIASLFLRTLSKPIANKIKQQAKEHDGFKTRTITMAQWLHRAEMNLRVKLLGESPKHVRPLSEARAIDAGANFLSEGFLFSVAATIIIGETYRSRRSDQKKRDAITDSLTQHDAQLEELRAHLDKEKEMREEAVKRERELEKIVEEIVLIGLHGGFGELPPDWQRHLRVGQLAREFGSAGRLLRDDEEGEDGGEQRLEKRDEPREENVELQTVSTDLAKRIAEVEGEKKQPIVEAPATKTEGEELP